MAVRVERGGQIDQAVKQEELVVVERTTRGGHVVGFRRLSRPKQRGKYWQ